MDLLEAVQHGDTSEALRLMQKPGAVHFANEQGDTALLIAAWAGHEVIVVQLLAAGANVHHTNNHGVTALIWAAQRGHRAIVQKLVVAGAKLEHAENDGETALLTAATQGHAAVVDALLMAGARIDCFNTSGHTALHCAAFLGCNDVAYLLLLAGANPTLKDHGGFTPLGMPEIKRTRRAAQSGDLVELRRFVEAHKNAIGHHNRTPLHLAAKYSRTETVRELVCSRAKVDDRDASGWTALHFASQCGCVEIVTCLLKGGCDPNILSKHGNSPIMLAAFHGHVDVVRDLYAHGADMQAVAKDGCTLLHLAAKHAHSAAVVEFLVNGLGSEDIAAMINKCDANGSTPLHHAVRVGNVATALLLLTHGANVDATNLQGESPLLLASARGDSSLVQLLLEHGATTDMASLSGRTPLSVAQSEDIRAVLQLFHDSQKYHAKCLAMLIQQDDARPWDPADLMEFVPLITSVYDLRLLISIISLHQNESKPPASPRSLLLEALGHVVAKELVFHDAACVYFKLVLHHCEHSKWITVHDKKLLKRKAEKINTQSADWVRELQTRVHENSWRLDAHGQCLRRVVDGMREVCSLVTTNRTAVKDLATRVGDLQSHVAVGQQIVNRLIGTVNGHSAQVAQLQQRLTQSETNLLAVGDALESFRTAYVTRLEQEETNKKLKLACGLLASIAGFAFAPLLTTACDAVIDFANPIEILNHAYTEQDAVAFLSGQLGKNVMVPLVKSQLEKMVIPEDSFEMLLKEEIARKHPEMVEECKSRGWEVDVGGTTQMATKIRAVEPAIEMEATMVPEIVRELQAALEQARRATVATPSNRELQRDRVASLEAARRVRSNQEEEQDQELLLIPLSNQDEEDDHATGAAATNDKQLQALSIAAEPQETVVFTDENPTESFPYHSAVHASQGDLAAFEKGLDGISSKYDNSNSNNNDDNNNGGTGSDLMAVAAMQIRPTTTTRETLCAAQYAYYRGYRDVGDELATRMGLDTTVFDQTPAVSVELLEDDDEFAYICIVNVSNGDIDECRDLCDALDGIEYPLGAAIHAQVVHERTTDVTWTAVELASHLGYVDILKYLLKKVGSGMSAKAKIQWLKRVQERRQQAEAV